MEGEMPIQRYVTELNPGSRREPVPPRRDAVRSGPCAAGWPRKCGGGRWQSGPGATHSKHGAGHTAVTSVAELPLPGTSNKEASQLERLSFRATGTVDGRSVGTGWPGKRPQAAGKQTPFRGAGAGFQRLSWPHADGSHAPAGAGSKKRALGRAGGARAGGFSWPDWVRRGQLLGEDELDPQPWASALPFQSSSSERCRLPEGWHQGSVWK